jgi:hypothetical protein
MTLDEQMVKLIQTKEPDNQKLIIELIKAQVGYKNILAVIVVLKDNPNSCEIISKDSSLIKKIQELLKPSLIWNSNVINYSYATLYELALTILEFKTQNNLEKTLSSYHNYLDGLCINAINKLKNDKGHNKDIKGTAL